VEWSLTPGDVAAVPVLRHQIMTALRGEVPPGEDLAAAEVVIAELLSNAVAHGTGPSWVTLRWEGVHPMLSVADAGPDFRPGLVPPARIPGGDEGTVRPSAVRPSAVQPSAVPQLPADPLAPSGRGLYLVSKLALDLAVRPRDTGGTVVSATLNLRRSPVTGRAS
jgi:anti-sigma regulatory factor (Ser/Thr protein kinase)